MKYTTHHFLGNAPLRVDWAAWEAAVERHRAALSDPQRALVKHKEAKDDPDPPAQTR